jgi:hypothetical protein
MGIDYEVRLHGVVSARLLDTLCDDLDLRADTILAGEVRDQAALHGLLARIRDTGIELVDVRQVPRASCRSSPALDDGRPDPDNRRIHDEEIS